VTFISSKLKVHKIQLLNQALNQQKEM